MIDMSDVIKAKSDQLNADDLIGGGITVKINKVSLVGGDQPCVIHYEGDNGKPWKPSKGMRRVLVAMWGKDANKYIGRSLTLYRNPDVKWAGEAVGGIQISHMSDIDSEKKTIITLSRSKKEPYKVQPLIIEQAPMIDITELKRVAGEKALTGQDELKAWFDSLSTGEKKAIKPHMEEFKQLANQESVEL